jgi:hypothetical protein
VPSTGLEQIISGGSLKRLLITAALILCWTVPAQASGIKISHVFSDPMAFIPTRGQATTISFRLSVAAKVSVMIYDARDVLVRTLLKQENQKAGDHRVRWDGKDNAGRPVPPNYYIYTIKAVTDAGDEVIHDLTDITGGRLLEIKGAEYDRTTRKLSYVLPEDALVNIRVGLPKGGPLLTTVVDWVPRRGGLNQETWNGWDASGSVNIADMKNVQIGVFAYSLPRNTIIVLEQNAGNRPKFIGDILWRNTKRAQKRQHRKEMYNHWQHLRDKCHDPAIKLSLPQELPINAAELPVISGPVPIRMTVAEEDVNFLLDQRFEVVFYVDFIFMYEEELGYTPFSWVWNPAGTNEGVHYITVMLRGYEGHFGTATKKVFVKASTNK